MDIHRINSHICIAYRLHCSQKITQANESVLLRRIPEGKRETS